MEVNGKMKPVKAVRNITGHNILRYKIHGDKQVPFVKTKTNQRMEEGDIFAIETFGTTGKAWMHDDVGIYGYGRDTDVSASLVSNASARSLLKKIDENFGTLVFSKRFLGHAGIKNYHLAMKHLIDQGIIDTHGPLVDVPGSHVAQFEHVSCACSRRSLYLIVITDGSLAAPVQRGRVSRRRLLVLKKLVCSALLVVFKVSPSTRDRCRPLSQPFNMVRTTHVKHCPHSLIVQVMLFIVALCWRLLSHSIS